jgi:uridine kinase
MLADELAARILSSGRPVIRASIDGFHRPKAERYVRGRASPEGYYYDARDLDAVMALLLVPLGPGGDRRYRTASFDLENDRPLAQDAMLASPDGILLVDGNFLQRPELRTGFDLTIFVDIAKPIALARAIARDSVFLGGTQITAQLYAMRYEPAFELYERLCAPQLAADAVFNNDDLAHPRLAIRAGGRLGAAHDPRKV